MSVTLSNGYRKPENGDLGTSWFPDLAFNIERVNGHSHNGVDSNKLTATSFSLLTANLTSGDFSIVGDKYRALVSVPSGVTVDGTNISFRDQTTKQPIYLDLEKVTNTSFHVFSILALDLEIVYG